MGYAPLSIRVVEGTHRVDGNDSDIVLRFPETGVVEIPNDENDPLPLGFQFSIESTGGTVALDLDPNVVLGGSDQKSVRRFGTGVFVKENANFWLISLGTGGGGGGGNVPLPPTVVACVGGPGSVSILWSPPLDDGGSAITGYVVEQSEDQVLWGTGAINQPNDVDSIFVDLTPGKTYYYRIKASNEFGFSDYCPVVSAVPSSDYNEADGGVETSYEENGRFYAVHTFNSDGEFTITKAPNPFRVLVVGGGGAGGGNTWGGGGGAGGVSETYPVLPVDTLNVDVGGQSTASVLKGPGSKTYASAQGGQSVTGANDGGKSGAPTVFNGGKSGNSTSGLRGGGGAGAGGDGLPYNYNFDALSSRGGNPVTSDITGAVVSYAGGGSGCWAAGGGPDGPGGGGGAWNTAGAPNTGGGGGGGYDKVLAGGSGVVIISYEKVPVTPKPVVVHSNTGEWTITNYDPSYQYQVSASAGTAVITGNKVTGGSADCVITIASRFNEKAPPSIVKVERASWFEVQCGSYQCCNNINPCPCGCCECVGGATECYNCCGQVCGTCYNYCAGTRAGYQYGPGSNTRPYSGGEWFRIDVD